VAGGDSHALEHLLHAIHGVVGDRRGRDRVLFQQLHGHPEVVIADRDRVAFVIQLLACDLAQAKVGDRLVQAV